MRDESPHLNRIVKTAFKYGWMRSAGIKEEDLTPENHIELDVIFSGIISTVGANDFLEDPMLAASIVSRPLGQGIIATLQHLGK